MGREFDTDTIEKKPNTTTNKKFGRDIAYLTVIETSKLKILSNHSHIHFRCACLCANSCITIEKTYSEDEDQKIQNRKFNDVQAYATGSIMSIVAYLESTINEFFSDCLTKTGNYQNYKGLGDDIIENLNNYWNQINKKGKYISILEKYLEAYKQIKGKEYQYDQNILDLIRLRNKLVHYEPKWQFTGQNADDPYKIKGLEGKFPPNKFRENTPNPFFPDKCLGAGCALWAIDISEKFVKEFFTNINVNPTLYNIGSIKVEIFG